MLDAVVEPIEGEQRAADRLVGPREVRMLLAERCGLDA